ncbi:hypothetical protein BCR33DRAFT_720633 [Rhizoclosmatium globosum]|uniref:beta-glucosidase n=1 Tax=Rhizoclosmatium globosum TaxID=329046 RepID=A0A1Y2BV11_9FUNG|nr:hypothetical protein BCR33DRAFT_720633 [Rhizoclosmatium globosum]|eukprot:ORY38612.1 hypothetical protein BCR33DRAFT_720633 [Rhizoclosmatium globosum]
MTESRHAPPASSEANEERQPLLVAEDSSSSPNRNNVNVWKARAKTVVVVVVALILVHSLFAAQQRHWHQGPGPGPVKGKAPHLWDAAATRATAALAKLTREQKEALVIGVGVNGGPCVGYIPPQKHIDFHGLCLQDGPMGVRFAANVTAFPSAMNTAATWDKSSWPSGDPYLASVSVSETVRGIQSHGVMATAKHFIANEQEHFRFDYSSNVDMRTMMEVYMAPFEASVRAGVASIMCSYNRVNQTYTGAHHKLMNEILKGPEIDFRGFYMTDWDAKYSFGVTDMVMPGLYRKDLVVDGMEPREIPEPRLNDMVVSILSPYYYFGQDKGFPALSFDSWKPREKNVYAFDYRFKQHAAVARKLAAASTILLKNDHALLPLNSKQVGVVAVIGEDARRPRILNEFPDRNGNDGTLAQGSGSGTADFPYLVSPLEAIADRVQVITSIDNYDLEAAKRTASSAQVALVFANAPSGEWYDRDDLKLANKGDQLISAVASVNKNTVVVIHSVGTVEMPWLHHPNISAVIFALLPGQESGNGLADVLFGAVNPSGRLPFTVHDDRNDYPADILYQPNAPIPQIDYSEKLLIDYRYFDFHKITPTFEFGYGLSYTTFQYSRLQIERANVRDTQSDLSISFKVTNTGTRDGHEVVQLYVSFPEAAGEPPQLLKGFERVWVKKGETVDVALVVEKRDLRIWLEGWKHVAGDYKFRVGASSRDIRLEKSVYWG